MNRVFWKNTRGFTDTLQKWMLLLTSTGSKPRTKSRRKKAIYRRPEYKASKDSVRRRSPEDHEEISLAFRRWRRSGGIETTSNWSSRKPRWPGFSKESRTQDYSLPIQHSRTYWGLKMIQYYIRQCSMLLVLRRWRDWAKEEREKETEPKEPTIAMEVEKQPEVRPSARPQATVD